MRLITMDLYTRFTLMIVNNTWISAKIIDMFISIKENHVSVFVQGRVQSLYLIYYSKIYIDNHNNTNSKKFILNKSVLHSTEIGI